MTDHSRRNLDRRMFLAGALAASALPAFAQDRTVRPGQHPRQVEDLDLYFRATPDAVALRMFELARMTKDDVLLDLGSGDGAIPILAAKKYGIRARGIELVGERVAIARANAKQAGVDHLVTFEQADVLKANFSGASVVTIYLFAHVMERLRPRLQKELKSGTRIVSHEFLMYGWPPKQTVYVGDAQVHLWVVE